MTLKDISSGPDWIAWGVGIIMGIFENVLPASFAAITLIFIIVDCAIIIVLANTVCKK